MKRTAIVMSAIAAVVAFGQVGSASAQTVSPGAWNQASGQLYSWSGEADLFSTISIGCNVTGGIKTVSPGSGSTTTTTSVAKPFSKFLSLCGTIEILTPSWATTIGNSTNGGVTWPITIAGVTAKTTTGSTCSGTLTGQFNEATQKLLVSGILTPGSATCEVDLELTPSPALYIAP